MGCCHAVSKVATPFPVPTSNVGVCPRCSASLVCKMLALRKECEGWFLTCKRSLCLLVFLCTLGVGVYVNPQLRACQGEGAAKHELHYVSFAPSPTFLHVMVVVPRASRGPFAAREHGPVWVQIAAGLCEETTLCHFENWALFCVPGSRQRDGATAAGTRPGQSPGALRPGSVGSCPGSPPATA